MRRAAVLLMLVLIVKHSWAEECHLPNNLLGLTLLLRVNRIHTPDNPMAGMVHEWFFGKKHYQITLLNTRKTAKGTYQYTRFTEQLARLSVQEGPIDERSVYSITFVCETEYIGYYIFSQTIGDSQRDVRQNTGVYIIQ
ncbi:hypothetical protein [uncultured Shewanella sp.]|uniref:hypothetical protein n=1 Tax=uncultured Shewanella sp. TaxID=173975 RepID=UPI0026185902|nr:hypothetical protein [uncultured Shewanella sp.]